MIDSGDFVSGNIPEASKEGTRSGVATEGTNHDQIVGNDGVQTKR